MYNGNTVSLKSVLWKVMNNPLAADLSYEQAAEFAIEAIRLIGAPLAYEDKVSPKIKVESYKALLPSNIITVRGVRAFSSLEDGEQAGVALTRATDIYHKSAECHDANIDASGGLALEMTYTIQSGIMTTSFEEGYVEVSYNALAVDEDDFPLIPDNQKVLQAVEYYILFRFLEPLYMLGKITDKAFEYINQKKLWYMGAANSDMQLTNMDHAEAMMNSVNRLIVNSQAHSNFFRQMGQKEHLKRYN